MQRKQNGKYKLRDFGGEPLVLNIDRAANFNQNFRTALWTGDNLQVTLMSIPPKGEIGLEMHPNVDQFIRLESGNANVIMGQSKDNLDYLQRIGADYAVIIPAGIWHNIVNIGNRPLKLYSVYAPPNHPFGTVHTTMAEAEKEENAGR